MTRFRCAVIDEIGSPATRIIDARDRNQAVLLLLAEGAQPVSIERDTPSLTDRLKIRRPGNAFDRLLSPLARLVAAGLSIPEAAVSIDHEGADRIAAGEAVGKIVTDTADLPPWIGAALKLAAARGNERGALPVIVEDAAAIAKRRTAIQAMRIEAGIVLMVVVLVSWSAGFLVGVGVAMAATVAMIFPRGPVAEAIEQVRIAAFLQIFARVSTEGAQPAEAMRLASIDTVSPPMRARIDAITREADMMTSIVKALRLSPLDTAIMLAGDGAANARDVSAHLAATGMERLDLIMRIMRLSALAVVAVGLALAVAG